MERSISETNTIHLEDEFCRVVRAMKEGINKQTTREALRIGLVYGVACDEIQVLAALQGGCSQCLHGG